MLSHAECTAALYASIVLCVHSPECISLRQLYQVQEFCACGNIAWMEALLIKCLCIAGRSCVCCMKSWSVQVPQGATPRSLQLQLKGELTRSVKPGDSVTMTGIHLTEPYTGFRAMRAGLLTNTYTEAMHVEHNKQSYADLVLSNDKESQLSVSACHNQLHFTPYTDYVQECSLVACFCPR